MRRLIPLALLAAVLSGSGQAQVFRSAPSVVPFGARSAAPPASVLSLGPNRTFAPPASVLSLGPGGFNKLPVLLGPRFFHRRHRFVGNGAIFPVTVPVYIPYAVPVEPYTYDTAQEVVLDPAQPESTLVEQRPAMSYSSAPQPDLPPNGAPERQQAAAAPATSSAAVPAQAQMPPEQAPVEPQSQPRTVLVFKDGHRLEVTNYAIQGDMIFNLSGNGPRKIAIADLNVGATTKENDEHGVDFRLP